MEVRTRNRENVTILELSGDVTLGEGVEILRSNVLESAGGSGTNILFNLGGVNFMDSSGVGELIAAYTTLSNRGGSVKLLHLSPKVYDVLQIAHLLTVFEVFDDEDEAISSFG
jgi:anti-sigma B factor antagonist